MAISVSIRIETLSSERRTAWEEALRQADVPVARDIDPFGILLTDEFEHAQRDGGGPGQQNSIVFVNRCFADAAGGAAPKLDLMSGPTLRLPGDASPREIAMGCLLLAEIVRLRRSQRDASQREAQWKQLADVDPLTGVLNRRGFQARLAEALPPGSPRSCCLALLDIDHFKAINDGAGHPAGDQVLQGAAQRLSAGVRSGDLVCRLGGDEFLIALFEVPADAAGRLVDRLRRAMGEAESPLESPVTVSAGWSVWVTETEAVSNSTSREAGIDTNGLDFYPQAFERAAANLRIAKSSGRDRTFPS